MLADAIVGFRMVELLNPAVGDHEYVGLGSAPGLEKLLIVAVNVPNKPSTEYP